MQIDTDGVDLALLDSLLADIFAPSPHLKYCIAVKHLVKYIFLNHHI